MSFYVISRFKSREPWHNMSDDEQERWIAESRKIRDAAGIKKVQNYRSYSGKGVTGVVEVPSFEAWDVYFKKVRDPKGLHIDHYFNIEFDLCHVPESR